MTALVNSKTVLNDKNDLNENNVCDDSVTAKLTYDSISESVLQDCISCQDFEDFDITEFDTPASYEEESEKDHTISGETFADASAPWVGAEQAWRQGIVPPPHKDWVNYRFSIERTETSVEDLALTDEEVTTVLSSLPPPPPPNTRDTIASVKRHPLEFVKYIAVSVIAIAIIWVVFTKTEHLKITQDKANIISLPMLIESSSHAQVLPTVQPTTSEIAGSANIHSSSVIIVPKFTEQEEADKAISQETMTEPRLLTDTLKASTKTAASEKSGNKKSVTLSSSMMRVDENSLAEVISVPSPRNPYDESVENDASNPDKNAENSQKLTIESQKPDETVSDTMAELDKTFGLSNPYKSGFSLEKQKKTDSTLPDTLSRDTVRQVMLSIEPEVKRCSDGRDGKVIVDFVVSGATGRVTEASLLPSKLSGSIGHCVARAIRFAKFPKFEKNTLNIKYPFEFHLDQ